MAQFSPAILTNAGKRLIALAIQGHSLKFTRGQAGSGFIASDDIVQEFISLKQPKRDLQIESVRLSGTIIGEAIITLNVNNAELLEGFFIREIGLFAEDPITHEEFLYSYTNSGDTADFLPAQDSPNPVWYRFQIQTVIDQAEDVQAIITDNPLGVSFVELQDAIDTTLKFMRTENAKLQAQINTLSEAIIRGSLLQANIREENRE